MDKSGSGVLYSPTRRRPPPVLWISRVRMSWSGFPTQIVGKIVVRHNCSGQSRKKNNRTIPTAQIYARKEATMYKRMNFWLVVVLAALLMFGITPKNSSQQPPRVFSAVNQFSITQNPNGPWSYGFTEGLGGPFTLHTNNCTMNCGPGGIYQGWFGLISSFYPWVVRNDGAEVSGLSHFCALPVTSHAQTRILRTS